MKHKQLWRILSVLCVASLLLTLGACTGKKWADDKPYEGYELEDYIQLGEYKGIEVEYVTQEEYLQLYAESVFAQYGAAMGITDDPEKTAVAMGDMVYFDFEGTAPGISEETKEGMKGTALLVIGSGKFIPGFEEQMVDQPRGKEFTVEVTFPEGYGQEGTTQAELNGQDATFKCTAHKIGAESKEVTDEGASALTGGEFPTAKAFLDMLLQDLEAELPEQMRQYDRNAAFKAAFDSAEVLKYPEREQKYWDEQIAENASRQGAASAQEYAQAYGYASAEAFRDEQVGLELFVFAVARAEGITVSDEQMQTLLTDIRESNGDTGTDAELFSKYGGKGRMLRHLTQENVTDFIYENAKNSPAAGAVG